MIMIAGLKPRRAARGPRMGMDSVARPEVDGMRKDSRKRRRNEPMVKTTAGVPLRAFAEFARTRFARPVLFMRTETPRETAMIMTTDIMSPAPAMNVSTISCSDSPPMMPMMMASRRNQVVDSAKYHWPRGVPVRNADQPASSVTVVVSLPLTFFES